MRTLAPRAAMVVALYAASISLGMASCTDDKPKLTDAGGPPGTDAGTTFAPQGCSFTAGAVDQFPNFELSGEGLGTDSAPRHVRIGLGGNVEAGKPGYADPSTTLSAVWQTDVATTGSKLRYGSSESTLDKTVEGVSYVIPQELKAGPEEGIRFHEAHACSLEPGRTYYYQVGGGPTGKEVWSKTFMYATAPKKGSTDKVSIGFAGDSRDALGRSDLPIWRAIGGRMLLGGVRMVLFSGDFVLIGADQSMWDKWSTAADGFA